MATLTIRNLPDDVVDRLKEVADAHGVSMEQEVRGLLEARYASREEVLDRIKARWDQRAGPSAAAVKRWRNEGRK